MTIEVSTGRTKEPAGVDLLPIVLGDDDSDKVFLLLHIESRGSGAETLEEESKAILKHAILEGEGDAATRLEGALKELNGLMKGLLLTGAMQDIHAIVGLFERNGVLHLSHAGRAEAYLVRDGTAAQITEYSRGKPVSSFLHIATGALQERDHVILSTQRLLRTFTPAQLTQVVQRGGDILKEITSELGSEKESACLLHIAALHDKQATFVESDVTPTRTAALKQKSARRRLPASASFFERFREVLPSADDLRAIVTNIMPKKLAPKKRDSSNNTNGTLDRLKAYTSNFLADLRHPERKRRAHLLLLAAAGGIFLLFWVGVQLTLLSQKSQSREELKTLVQNIDGEIKKAENRKLAGDNDSANKILDRAQDMARQVMENESGLYRGEALNLLDQIRQTKEEINNIVRVPPRVVVNLSAKNADVDAQGMLGIGEGEFLVYDRQKLYRVLLNTVDDPEKLDDQELILDATVFPRFQTRVFMTTGNSLIEIINGQPTTMKTEDAAGWVSGNDIETYLRYLYILAPDKNQIFKYERLANRYGPAVEYNVNGDLKGAIDMAVDGDVYILKDDGTVVKLLRGEQKPFTIRNLPEGALKGVTKVFKASPTSNIYFLNPTEGRIVVASSDSDLGESSYIRQYVLDLADMTDIKDLYVDPDDTRLYVLDAKRLYSIDLQSK